MKKLPPFLKSVLASPFFWFFVLCFYVFSDFFLKGKIPMPADMLVGSYFPWLDNKWGFPTGVPVKNPPISDVFSQFFIWKYLVIDLITHGVVPLWNRFMFSGTPLLASYHWAAFFPGNLILLLPRYFGWGLYIFLSIFSAGAFMYLYLGTHVSNRWAKLGGAIVFAFGGLMTTWAEFGTGVWAAAFIPLCLYLIDKFIETKKSFYLPLLSLSLATLILAGHVQIDTYLALLIPFYIGHRLGWKPSWNNLRLFLSIGLACVLGALLCSFQLLPTLDFFNSSIREQEKYSVSFNYGLTPLTDMIRIFVPDFFGHPSTYNFFSNVSYHENASFVGALTLPLILALIFTLPLLVKNIFYVLVFLITLILAIDTPLSQFIFQQPIPLLTYSSASRLFFINTFAAGYLLAQALSALAAKKLSLLKISLGCLLFIGLVYLSLQRLPLEKYFLSLRNSVLSLGMLGTLAVAPFILRHHRRLLLLLLLALLSFDMQRYFLKYNPFVAAHIVFPTTPAIEFLQKQPGVFRIARSKTNVLTPNTWLFYKLEAIEGYDPLRLLSYNRLFNVIKKTSYNDAPSRYSELDTFNPLYLDALNVKYFVTLGPTKISAYTHDSEVLQEYGYKIIMEDKTTRILENPTVKPRAYFVDDYLIATNEAHLAKIFTLETFDPRSSAILLESPTPNTTTPKEAKVTIDDYSDNRLALSTSSLTDSLLLNATSFDTGWQATIDNQPAPILKADGALMALAVPAGKHKVVFEYRPSSFYLGLKISLLALLVTIASFFILRPKK